MARNPLRPLAGAAQEDAAFLERRRREEAARIEAEEAARIEALEQEAEALRKANAVGQLAPYSSAIEAEINRQFQGNLDVANTREAQDTRRRIVLQEIERVARQQGVQRTPEQLQTFRTEVVEALLSKYGGQAYIPDSALGGAGAAPSAGGNALLASERARGEAESDDAGTGFVDTLTSLTSAATDALGSLIEGAGSLANDAYDNFQQMRAIDREVARLSAKKRAEGTLPPPSRGAAAALRREAENNITEKLKQLDTTPDNVLTGMGNWLQGLAADIDDAGLSEEARRDDADLAAEDTVTGKLDVMLRSPIRRLAQMGGFLLGSGGVVGGARAGAARTLGNLGQITAANKLTSGGARLAGVASGQTLAIGGSVESETREYLGNLSDEDLMKTPLAQDIIERLGSQASVDRVRNEVTEVLAKRSRNIGFAAAAAGIFIGSRTELIAGQAARAALTGSITPLIAGARGGAVRGAAREALGEAIQEGGEDLAAQVGRDQEIDLNSLRVSAGLGAIIGGPLGAVGGALDARTRNPLEAQPDTDPGTGTDDTVAEPTDFENETIAEDSEYHQTLAEDPDAALGASDPVGILQSVKDLRAELRSEGEAVTADYDAALTVEADQVLQRATATRKGNSAEAKQTRSLLAFDSLLAATNTTRQSARVPTDQLGSTASRVAIASGEGVATPTNPLLSASRQQLDKVARQLTPDVLPPSATISLQGMRDAGAKLVSDIAPMFNTRNEAEKIQATFERLVSRGVDNGTAIAFSEVIAPVPRGDLVEAIETAVQANPELQPAATVFSQDLATFRDVNRQRRRISGLVNASERGDAITLDTLLDNPRVEQDINDLEAAVEAANVTSGGVTPESGPQVAGLVRASSLRPGVRQSFKNLTEKPLSIRTVVDPARAMVEAIPRTIWAMDSLDGLRKLQQALHAKAGEGNVDPALDTAVHTAYSVDGLGQMQRNEALISEQFVTPMADKLEELRDEFNIPAEDARETVNTFLINRAITERVPALFRRRSNLLNKLGLQAFNRAELELRESQRPVAEIRQELDDIFNDKSNYKNPKSFVPVDKLTYLGKTIDQASSEVEAALEGPLGDRLGEIGELTDKAATMIRNWQRDANLGGDGGARVLELNSFQHYVPIALEQDQQLDFTQSDQFNLRNAGRKRFSFADDFEVKDVMERMYIQMSRASTMSAEARFHNALANAVEQLDNSGVGIVERGNKLRFNPQTGRHFYDNMPTAAEANVFVRYNQDGSFDKITVRDPEILEILTDRFKDSEADSGAIVPKGVGKLTRLRARLFTSLNPAFIYSTTMFRAAQEGMGIALSNAGESTLASKSRVLMAQSMNTFASAYQGFPILGAGTRSLVDRRPIHEFYAASATRQKEMAKEFEKSGDRMLEIAAARYRKLGTSTFGNQLGSARIFASQDGKLKKPGAIRNGWELVKRQTESSMTAMDNMIRNATVATLADNGMAMDKAIDLVETQYNVRLQSGLRRSQDAKRLFAFFDASNIGIQAAVTRRLFRGGDVPLSLDVDPETGQQVVGLQSRVDWAEAAKAISKSQVGMYAALGMGSSMMYAMAAGNEVDEDGTVRPSHYKLPAIRLMTNFMTPEMMDENGVPEPTRIPQEFGAQMMIQGLASGAVLVANGTHSLDEVADAYLELLYSSLVPLGRVDPGAIAGAESADDTVKRMLVSFAPTAIDAPVQALFNLNGFGNSIFNAENRDAFIQSQRFDDLGEPDARPSTEDMFVDIAQGLADMPFGPQLNLDSPEVVKHWFRSYLGYPAQAMLAISSEARRKVEDPSYEGSDMLRRFPGSPVRSEQGARYSAMNQAFAITRDVFAPMQQEMREATRAARAGNAAPLNEFNRRNPDYGVAAGIIDVYFDDVVRIGNLLDEARASEEDGYRPERIKELTLQRDERQKQFLRDWYKAFPKTRPEDPDGFVALID